MTNGRMGNVREEVKKPMFSSSNSPQNQRSQHCLRDATIYFPFRATATVTSSLRDTARRQ
jgi:hypothetical protein